MQVAHGNPRLVPIGEIEIDARRGRHVSQRDRSAQNAGRRLGWRWPRCLDAQGDYVALTSMQSGDDVGVSQATRPLHVTVLHFAAVDEEPVGPGHLAEIEVDSRRQLGWQAEREPVPAYALIVGEALLLPGVARPDRTPPGIVIPAGVPARLEAGIVRIGRELPHSAEALVVGWRRRDRPPERPQHLRGVAVAVGKDALLRVGVAGMIVQGEPHAA